jgi:methionyl-tRNA formyltransferase
LCMKIIFFGSTDFSLPILKNIHGKSDIRGVVTSKPRPKGRGLKTALAEIATWAKGAGLEVFMPDDPNSDEFVRTLSALSPDLHVLSAYGHILSKELLDVARLGGINIHPSLLPRYRGAAPIQRAIMAGEEKTGVTLFFMDEKIDHGDVVEQRWIPIEKDDTYGSLSRKLADLGAQMIVDVLHAVESGNYRTIKQAGEISLAPKVKKEELVVDWHESAMRVYNHIRALSPKPGARTYFRNRELMITLAQLGDKRLAPGRLCVENKKLYVGTGDGSLVLLEVQPEGKRVISALDFINGYRIKEGEVVG